MVDVLYIEDNPNDADIFGRLMRKMNLPFTYTVLDNGAEAIDYLMGQGRFSTQVHALPRLILLDLNLTGLTGVEVVQHARSLTRTRFVPIVAFSTSDRPYDIKSAYEAGVNAYVMKPGSYQATGTVISKLCGFWLEHNIRPD